jgi:hypothetical protein
MVMEMIAAAEVREEDETYQSPGTSCLSGWPAGAGASGGQTVQHLQAGRGQNGQVHF